MGVCRLIIVLRLGLRAYSVLFSLSSGHTARPTDFCWAPGIGEQWTAASTSEDNIIMVWQPTMRIWAADNVKIAENELEDAMDIEPTNTGKRGASTSMGVEGEDR
jgi:histone-binding protein RBBP4